MAQTTTRPATLETAPACLRVPEVAAILGISRATAYALVNSEGFPRLAIGTRLVVPKDALERWISKNTKTA
ncbi:MAG: helix-turn-helix domain-containing protein [Oscillospiraceae bacterium]|jgi:excisionase family DNA binding protein|nr:helix-turn-helix domain-containing protein [Oscillospiraceae bacterium]